jgi:hypothetical protein
VVVASATADQGGNYPLPGTVRNPTGFAEIPAGQRDFALRVSASGYTTLISSAFASAQRRQTCSEAAAPDTCNFSLTTGYINGTVNLFTDPPPGSSAMVQVFAENSGTNQLVSALTQPLLFRNGESSKAFTLNVPINSNPFDLFAVAIDPFQGGPDPFPGHDIPVLANQPAPAAGCNQTTTTVPFLPMNCTGHGSISGTVQNPDTGTSVVVEKLDPPPSSTPVQILATSPALFSSNTPSNNAYTLCVPPDNYELQRFEAPVIGTAPTATPTAVGSPQSIAVPVPASTSSPCPSTCSNTNTGPAPCPGRCNSTAASPL